MTPPAGALLALPRETIHTLVDCLGLSTEDLALILGTDKRTIERWRSGAIANGKGRDGLNMLQQLSDHLINSLGPEAARSWLHSSSGYFGGLTPVQVLRGGGGELVPQIYSALDAFETGAAI